MFKSLINRPAWCRQLLYSFVTAIHIVTYCIPISYVEAAELYNLPQPGTMVLPTPNFLPPLIKGITIHPENPLQFDFIIHNGEDDIGGVTLEEESLKQIKYFLSAMTIPEDRMWVNLSPFENDRIISDDFGATEMGKDLLMQDYILKQLTASLIYPEDEIGKKFWERTYKRAYELLGTTEIPINTFNKIWIVPDKAVVYERNNTVFVLESRLKVMLEEDYLASKSERYSEHYGKSLDPEPSIEKLNAETAQIVREVLVPEIEREVNEGETFIELRQIYQSMILAAWYKNHLKQSLLGQVYADKSKTKGIHIEDPMINKLIYDQYLAAYEKGVYNIVQDEYDPLTQEMTARTYFSGGFDSAMMSSRALQVVSAQSPEAINDFNSLAQSPVDIVSARLAESAGETTLLMASLSRPTDESMAADVENIRQNALLMRSDSFRAVLFSESIGGNAGESRAAVNGVVDSQGRIVAFGNIQMLRDVVNDVDKRLSDGELFNFTVIVRITNLMPIAYSLERLGSNADALAPAIRQSLQRSLQEAVGSQASITTDDADRAMAADISTLLVRLGENIEVTDQLAQRLSESVASMPYSWVLKGYEGSLLSRLDMLQRESSRDVLIARGVSPQVVTQEAAEIARDNQPEVERINRVLGILRAELANRNRENLQELASSVTPTTAQTQPTTSSTQQSASGQLNLFDLPEDNAMSSREDIVQFNVDKLQSMDFENVLTRESFGGNAGELRAAVNGYINERGYILAFGNPLELSPAQRERLARLRQEGPVLEFTVVVKIDSFTSGNYAMERVIVRGDNETLRGQVEEILNQSINRRNLGDLEEYKKATGRRFLDEAMNSEVSFNALQMQRQIERIVSINGDRLLAFDDFLRYVDRADLQGLSALDRFIRSSGTYIQNAQVLEDAVNARMTLLQREEALAQGRQIVDPLMAERVNRSFGIDGQQRASPVGGIDFDPTLLDLQIKRDGRGVALPTEEQDLSQIKIDGFYPVIVSIMPLTDLPLQLGDLPPVAQTASMEPSI